MSKELRRKLVAVAAGELGVRESNSGDDKYIKWYNSATGTSFAMNVAWCAIFVSWCARQTGISTEQIPNYASCTYGGIAGFKQRGTYHERTGYTPKAGDIVFYNWNNDSASEHTGIVESVSGTAMAVIEGNYNDAVRRRSISTGSSLIMGYGCWDGDTSAGNDSSYWTACLQIAFNRDYAAGLETDGEKGPQTEAQMTAHVVKIGDTGDIVRWVQMRLVLLGYGVGSCGIDGDFGHNTDTAVRAFQTDHGLDVDGEVGVQTYTHFISA